MSSFVLGKSHVNCLYAMRDLCCISFHVSIFSAQSWKHGCVCVLKKSAQTTRSPCALDKTKLRMDEHAQGRLLSRVILFKGGNDALEMNCFNEDSALLLELNARNKNTRGKCRKD